MVMDLATEQQLVEKAKESLEAFEELYEYYLPKIYSYIYNRTADKELTEDITSKTFVKVMTKIRTFRYQGYSFGSWLYKIAHNTLIDYYRKNKRVSESHKQELKENHGATNQINDVERKLIVLEVLRDLPAQYQEILSLRYFEGLSNEEIARILGCRKDSVAVKIHRAIKSFRKIIGKQGYSDLIDFKLA